MIFYGNKRISSYYNHTNSQNTEQDSQQQSAEEDPGTALFLFLRFIFHYNLSNLLNNQAILPAPLFSKIAPWTYIASVLSHTEMQVIAR